MFYHYFYNHYHEFYSQCFYINTFIIYRPYVCGVVFIRKSSKDSHKTDEKLLSTPKYTVINLY